MNAVLARLRRIEHAHGNVASGTAEPKGPEPFPPPALQSNGIKSDVNAPQSGENPSNVSTNRRIIEHIDALLEPEPSLQLEDIPLSSRGLKPPPLRKEVADKQDPRDATCSMHQQESDASDETGATSTPRSTVSQHTPDAERDPTLHCRKSTGSTFATFGKSPISQQQDRRRRSPRSRPKKRTRMDSTPHTGRAMHTSQEQTSQRLTTPNISASSEGSGGTFTSSDMLPCLHASAESLSQSRNTTPSPPATVYSSRDELSSSQANDSRVETPGTAQSSRSHLSKDSDTADQVLVASPRTFGYPSPLPERRARSRSRSRRPRRTASPSPPLPALDHPDLLFSSARPPLHVQCHDTRTIARSHPTSASAALPQPEFESHSTRGCRADSASAAVLNIRNCTSSTPSPSRPSHTFASMSQIEVGDINSPTEAHCIPPRRSLRSLRTRSSIASLVRRSSAEWNSQQAIAGSAAQKPSDFGWPAEVTQELLKLSLGERPGKGGSAGRDSGDAEPRVFHAPARQSGTQRPGIPFPHLQSDYRQSSILEEVEPSDSSSDSSEGSSMAAGVFVVDDNKMAEHARAVNTLKKNGGVAPQPTHKRKHRRKRAANLSTSTVPVASTSRAPQTPKRNFPALAPSTPSVTPTGTPNLKPKSALKPARSASEPGLTSVPETPLNSKGKRKAEDLDTTPPEAKTQQQHATFVLPEEDRRTTRTSELSRAPSSYHRKRARISDTSPSPTPSRPPSRQGSWAYRHAPAPIQALARVQSRTSSNRVGSMRAASSIGHDRRKSISEMSIPISALIAPHAPSISRSSQYHMHDPRKPPKIHSTEWALRFWSDDEAGSPLQAWCFFIGFILFPVWWVASFASIPKTRRLEGSDAEKGVTLDDPQVEHDARTWRLRCRIMSGVSFLTYIPFIILIAVFVPRHV